MFHLVLTTKRKIQANLASIPALIHMLRMGVVSNALEAVITLTLALIVYKKWVPVWAAVISGIAIGLAI